MSKATFPAWSGAMDAPAQTFTLERLKQAIAAIEAYEPQPDIYYVPSATGTDQDARNARTVRLKNGMSVQLPEGFSAQEFMLLGEEVGMREVYRRRLK